MKMPVAKVVLATSVALATLIAAEAASAQPHGYRAAPEAYDSQANPNYQLGPRVTVRPGDIIEGGSVIGRDPDPFVRDQILRDYNSGRGE